MRELLEALRDTALTQKVDFADIRAMEFEGASVSLQDKKADKVYQYKSYGLGIRVLLDQAWGFASTSTYDRQQAFDCLRAAISMAKASKERVSEPGVIATTGPIIDRTETRFEKDPRSVPIQQKMEVLSTFEKEAIKFGGDKIVNSVLFYGDSVERMIICNTRGTFIETESMRINIGSAITARDGDIRQRGFEHRSALGGYELVEKLAPDEISVKAAKTAVSLLGAKRAPAGKFTVVFHPSVTGLLTHEALGHNAEADHVLSGESILEDKLGQKVASDCITIIDDATIEGSWGSYRYDSEGTPAQRRVLIEDGILKGFMHSLETAAKMGMSPNGSARAQDFSSRPIVRMSNTFIVPGKTSFEELIKDIDIDIYLKGGEWGYVFCERGQYTCHASEGWYIRRGQIAEHLRDVSISGMTLETLINADAVSSDFELSMPGMCGKNGQGMPINAGGPHVRVRDIVVGGQE